ncbi:MAG: hypothetical protein ACYS9T_05560 [Planctomycetota bacterium]|jgi:hypothetical protein
MKKKRLTKTELDIVRLRYFDGLLCKEIADKLSLTVHQVKYRLRKPSVKQYIRDVAVPQLLKPILKQIDDRLADPIASYMMQLQYELDAKTYIWVNGKKHYYDDNRKQYRALRTIGRIYGIAHDQKNIERDLRKAVAKHVTWLKEMKRKAEKALETGEIRFY